jgi:hypothetical protein
VSAERFKRAVESWDREALADSLAENVVFRSPVVFKPYEGREATLFVLDGVSRVFEGFEYVDVLDGERSAALIFRARVGEREVEGLDHLTFDDDGRISELRVMVRPMSAMHALAEAMRAELERAGAAAAAAD